MGLIPPSGALHTGMPVLGAEPVVLLSSKSRALACTWLAEGQLIFTPSARVESTDEIPGRSDSESNHPL